MDFVWSILTWIGGLILLCLFCGALYFVGQVGVLIRSGSSILRQLRKVERDGQSQGLPLNAEGIALRQKARLKLIASIVGLVVFYSIAFLFIPTLGMKLASLLLLVPIVMGYFGIFFVPDA